jgi:hypothetical protein
MPVTEDWPNLSPRDRDAKVAEIIWNWEPSSEYGWYGWHPRPCAEADPWQEIDSVPKYTTEDEEALKVMRRMVTTGWNVEMFVTQYEDCVEFEFYFLKNLGSRELGKAIGRKFADTLCLAAISAKENEDER